MEKKDKLKESTMKMYENTINQMVERGASEEDINIVKEARDRYLEAVDAEERGVKNWKWEFMFIDGAKKNSYRMVEAEPLKRNMFILRLGDIEPWCVKDTNIYRAENLFYVTFREFREFSPYDYLHKNRSFDKCTIELLDSCGETIRVETIKGVEVEYIERSELDYENDATIETHATFKFSEYECTTNQKERTVSETEVEDGKEKTETDN